MASEKPRSGDPADPRCDLCEEPIPECSCPLYPARCHHCGRDIRVCEVGRDIAALHPPEETMPRTTFLNGIVVRVHRELPLVWEPTEAHPYPDWNDRLCVHIELSDTCTHSDVKRAIKAAMQWRGRLPKLAEQGQRQLWEARMRGESLESQAKQIASILEQLVRKIAEAVHRGDDDGARGLSGDLVATLLKVGFKETEARTRGGKWVEQACNAPSSFPVAPLIEAPDLRRLLRSIHSRKGTLDTRKLFGWEGLCPDCRASCWGASKCPECGRKLP